MKELCLSKESFADGPAPIVGDAVRFETAGTVSRVEGDKIYVTAETANGAPLPDEAADAEPGDEEMRELAEEADSGRKEGVL